MNNTSENQKICPSCHKRNKGYHNYCRYCGASLEGIEPEKVEKPGILDTPETNKVEIIKSYKAKKYTTLICIWIFPLVFLGLAILTAANPILFLFFLLFGIFILILMICPFITALRMTYTYDRTREFSISDQVIKINIPKKFTFQINWSEFDTIQVDSTMGRSFGYNANSVYFHFHFFSKNQSVGIFVIETGIDFTSRTFNKISSLIKKYADRLNKNYRLG